jgi:hypothetical protein
VIGDILWPKQVEQLLGYLQSKNWQSANLTMQLKTGKSYYVVFATNEGLQILACSSHLTLIDLIYNINKLRWYLTTLMV